MHTLVAALLLQLATTTTVAAAVSNIALPGCDSKCGDVDIPYPFGTTTNCSRHGFLVTCRHSAGDRVPPTLTLGSAADDHGPPVLEISVANNTVRVRSQVWNFSVGNTSVARVVELDAIQSGRPAYVLSVSEARNRLVFVGCGFRAYADAGPTTKGSPSTSSNCSSSCPAAPAPAQEMMHPVYPCNGTGCCVAHVPKGAHTSFSVRLEWNASDDHSSPWLTTTSEARMVVVEQAWWQQQQAGMNGGQFVPNDDDSSVVVPAILDWAFQGPRSLDGDPTCEEAKEKPNYGCGKHSECFTSNSSAHGYVCRCRPGYHGNPYLPDGCQSPQSHFPHGVVLFAMGVGIGMCILPMVAATIFVTRKFNDQKAKKMKKYFFNKNRGLLLQQLVDKDIPERMILSLEELEKATNKFDRDHILGGGGHGIVYKGMLSNQRVVAIKKSKLVSQKEVIGFINEVVLLSQINHRNVVKLLGCCLEAEVPLLVYEFIPNGTLHAHLHVDNPLSLTWKDRLRIAIEVASALAYLHSAASIAIVHRDIKTSNILLDDRLIAKVSDFGASKGMDIDKSGLTTAIQGTYGYLDPEYYHTRRLTNKSDVYSYGVVLVELLTRRIPTIDMSLDGISLVAHFIHLWSEDRLSEILDVQFNEEEENDAKQVAEIAVSCLQLKGSDRPTMQHVAMRLQGLQCAGNNFDNNLEELGLETSNNTRFQVTSNTNAVYASYSRQYSMEREILASASLSR